MEAALSRQQQKVGKAAFLQAINKVLTSSCHVITRVILANARGLVWNINASPVYPSWFSLCLYQIVRFIATGYFFYIDWYFNLQTNFEIILFLNCKEQKAVDHSTNVFIVRIQRVWLSRFSHFSFSLNSVSIRFDFVDDVFYCLFGFLPAWLCHLVKTHHFYVRFSIAPQFSSWKIMASSLRHATDIRTILSEKFGDIFPIRDPLHLVANDTVVLFNMGAIDAHASAFILRRTRCIGKCWSFSMPETYGYFL